MTKDQLTALLPAWQKLLRLQDWDIMLTWTRHADGLGNVRLSGKYKTAEIELLEPDSIDPDYMGNKDPEVTLVHELLHVQAGQLTEFLARRENDRWYDDMERVVELTAITLVTLRRAAGPVVHSYTFMATLTIPFSPIASTGAGSIVALPTIPTAEQSGAHLVAELHIQPAPGNSASIQVVDTGTGKVLKTLPPLPTTGQGAAWTICSGSDDDGVNPAAFSIKFLGASDTAEGYAILR